ncbi:DUF6777 domain-containing protein [Streptomyces eurythermus]|uniref:DUF6777 domain-containing protein n=1 Tax=Streptomyces eurythermus TaxID=42237 RepID=UPI00367D4C09
MRIPTRTLVTACVLSVALLAAGCAGAGVKQTRVGDLVFLQAVGERGPGPFTDSAATGPAASESPRIGAKMSAGELAAPLRAARTVSGATPGLYRGTPRVARCDVERHIRYLAADPARADAFAAVVGVRRAVLPAYLRGLTPVVLGADTRVTNHAYQGRRADDYQAVLQAGTAVLVDDRGLPRVRCACGNPLAPPAPTRGGASARGTPWPGYRPNKVIVVSPAPRAVTSLTLVDAGHRTWTERRIGPDVRRDRVVPPPARATTSPSPTTRTTPAPTPTPPTASAAPTPKPTPPTTASDTAPASTAPATGAGSAPTPPATGAGAAPTPTAPTTPADAAPATGTASTTGTVPTTGTAPTPRADPAPSTTATATGAGPAPTPTAPVTEAGAAPSARVPGAPRAPGASGIPVLPVAGGA